MIPLSLFTNKALYKVSSHAFISDEESLERLLAETDIYSHNIADIAKRARGWIKHIHQHHNPSLMQAFLQEYGLQSHEGLSIMRLAECLLRIPDSATADKMIEDCFTHNDWKKHIGHSETSLVNASSVGLHLVDKLVGYARDDEHDSQSFIQHWLGKASEPLIRKMLWKAIRHMGSEFIIGQTIIEALGNAKKLEQKGYRISYDMLGESARNFEQAALYRERYHDMITAIGHQPISKLYERNSISIKLSALHPRVELMQWERLEQELLPELKKLLLHAVENNIVVTIDAEEATRTDVTLALFEALISDSELSGYDGLGIAVQAYQKRAESLIGYLVELAERYQKHIPVRLVKGAYWDSEIKAAQIEGVTDYPVYLEKHFTDTAYIACAQLLLQHNDLLFPQFATHNALTVAAVEEMAQGKKYEFQCLYGMGEALFDQLLDAEQPCRVYAPVGHYEDLLAYLIRRMLENGANTSFLHQLAKHKQDKGTDALLHDPVALTHQTYNQPHPSIPLPPQLYGYKRVNSAGIDIGNMAQLEQLIPQIADFQAQSWQAHSLIDGQDKAAKLRKITSPANFQDQVGECSFAKREWVTQVVEIAQKGYTNWQQVIIEERVAIIERVASLYEEHKSELIALCMRETGKVFKDAVAEIREAVDFCRYYGEQMREVAATLPPLDGPTGEINHLSYHSRGVFLCVSPWNFPLAIFTGQIAAALVTGNSVVAKPAEQSPLIAYRAVQLMHDAGVPTDVLQLCLGNGHVGADLVKHPGIAGVVFTGSLSVAQSINKQLAAKKGPIVPFIAETGGLNCMIVDSSALLEQVVDDVMASAFGSSGQRCSALRILLVQDEVADTLTSMLGLALQSWTVGHPKYLHTDMGPVIDKEAYSKITHHIAAMEKEATLIGKGQVNADWQQKGHYIAPHILEVAHVGQLQEEVFGPVLHVVRYKADELDQVIEQINGLGYGLTCGVHSRIDSRVEQITSQLRVGNSYVNRTMIGAVVGVQPFGGEGLSGTGPKAGGPNYLLRFMTERCVSNNSAAIGGNIGLLS